MSSETQNCIGDDNNRCMDRLNQWNSLLVQQWVDQNVTLGDINRKLNFVIEHIAWNGSMRWRNYCLQILPLHKTMRKNKCDLDIKGNDVALLNKVNRKIGMIFDDRTRWRLSKEHVSRNTNIEYKTTSFILNRAYINNKISSNELFPTINWISTVLCVALLNVGDNAEDDI